MNKKRYSKKAKIGAVVIAIVFLGSALLLPMSNAVNLKINKTQIANMLKNDLLEKPYGSSSIEDQKYWLDRNYPNENEQELSLALDQNDMGYNVDAKDKIASSLPLYVGEPVDQTVPGRGRQGTLDPSNGDDEDWLAFSVCAGQSIQASITTSNSFGVELADTCRDSCWSKLYRYYYWYLFCSYLC